MCVAEIIVYMRCGDHSVCLLQRSYGGEVIIAPSGVPADHPDHYQNMAVTLCKEHADYFDVDQYDNPNNPEAYYRSLGPEVCPICPFLPHQQ